MTTDLSILSGIIPSELVYGGDEEGDLEFNIKKMDEDDNIIYYTCTIIARFSDRITRFAYNKHTKNISSYNEVSEQYPVFRRMGIDYSDPYYNNIADIYIIDDDYIKNVYYDEYFADPYYRFPITKNGIGVSTLYYHIFTTINGINDIKIIYPKQYGE